MAFCARFLQPDIPTASQTAGAGVLPSATRRHSRMKTSSSATLTSSALLRSWMTIMFLTELCSFWRRSQVARSQAMEPLNWACFSLISASIFSLSCNSSTISATPNRRAISSRWNSVQYSRDSRSLSLLLTRACVISRISLLRLNGSIKASRSLKSSGSENASLLKLQKKQLYRFSRQRKARHHLKISWALLSFRSIEIPSNTETFTELAIYPRLVTSLCISLFRLSISISIFWTVPSCCLFLSLMRVS